MHGLITMRAFADFEGKAMAYGHETPGGTLEYGLLFEQSVTDLIAFSRRSAETFVGELLPHAQNKCEDWRTGTLREEARLRRIQKELIEEIDRIRRERQEAEDADENGRQGRELEMRVDEPLEGLPPEPVK